MDAKRIAALRRVWGEGRIFNRAIVEELLDEVERLQGRVVSDGHVFRPCTSAAQNPLRRIDFECDEGGIFAVVKTADIEMLPLDTPPDEEEPHASGSP